MLRGCTVYAQETWLNAVYDALLAFAALDSIVYDKRNALYSLVEGERHAHFNCGINLMHLTDYDGHNQKLLSSSEHAETTKTIDADANKRYANCEFFKIRSNFKHNQTCS